jgi:4-hydroxymandelate oxidase
MQLYKNIYEFATAAQARLEPFAFHNLTGGADDNRTTARNESAYQQLGLRPRVLVDVREVDSSVTLFGKRWKSPVVLAPVGMQGLYHPDAERATARAAQARGHLMIASTVTTCSFTDICNATDTPPWFQLYTTNNLEQTRRLITTAEQLGSEVLVLTVDVPVLGNREMHRPYVEGTMRENTVLGNFAGEKPPVFDASLTWDFIRWLRGVCGMKIVIKGIMTAEDAALALEYGADGIVVSNHGGRQLECGTGTIEVLPEIAAVIQKKIPLLLDGGIRRGTDVLKALALGADAVCIGRPVCYGLAAEGQNGVEAVLDILHSEIERDMRLLGARTVGEIGVGAVRRWNDE